MKKRRAGGAMIIDGPLTPAGTPASPIVLTSERDDNYGNPPDTNGDGSSTTPAANNWSYIHFTGTSNDAVCKLDNCKLLYGSSGPFDGWNTTLWITSAAPTITACTISKGTYGIRVDGNGTPFI